MSQRIAGSKTITFGLIAATVGLAGAAWAQSTPRTSPVRRPIPSPEIRPHNGANGSARATTPGAAATMRGSGGTNARAQFDPRFNLSFNPSAGAWVDRSGGAWVHVGGMAQQALDPRIRGALNPQMAARVNAGFVPQNWLGTPFFPVIPNPAMAAGVSATPGVTAGGNVAAGTNGNTRANGSGRVRVDMTTVYGPGADIRADQSVRGGGNGTDATARTRMTVRDGDRTPERVVARMETIMDDQALANASVVSTTKTSARLKFTADGRTHTANVPLSRVFFIDANGKVMIAAENRTRLGRGTRVLAPAPAELVAGSRQTTRTRTGTADDQPAR